MTYDTLSSFLAQKKETSACYIAQDKCADKTQKKNPYVYIAHLASNTFPRDTKHAPNNMHTPETKASFPWHKANEWSKETHATMTQDDPFFLTGKCGNIWMKKGRADIFNAKRGHYGLGAPGVMADISGEWG